eukprot:scaffold13117_cov19-Tisochrysis_lutea.AAC.1
MGVGGSASLKPKTAANARSFVHPSTYLCPPITNSVAAPKDAWGAGGGAFLKAALSSQSSSAKSSAPHASNKNSTALAPPHTPSTTTNRTPNGALPAAAGNGNSSSSRGSTGTTQGEAGGGDGREGVGLTAEEYAAQMHRSAAAVFLGRAAGQDVGVPINWCVSRGCELWVWVCFLRAVVLWERLVGQWLSVPMAEPAFESYLE